MAWSKAVSLQPFCAVSTHHSTGRYHPMKLFFPKSMFPISRTTKCLPSSCTHQLFVSRLKKEYGPDCTVSNTTFSLVTLNEVCFEILQHESDTLLSRSFLESKDKYWLLCRSFLVSKDKYWRWCFCLFPSLRVSCSLLFFTSS